MKISEIVRGLNRYVMAQLHAGKHQAHKRRSEAAKKAWRTRKAKAIGAFRDNPELVNKFNDYSPTMRQTGIQAPWANDHAAGVKQASGTERR